MKNSSEQQAKPISKATFESIIGEPKDLGNVSEVLGWVKDSFFKVSYCERNGILEALTQTRTSYTVLTAESVKVTFF